ncbi:MAG: hypothetical protein ACTSRU_16140 [Candidatus Hodarchaeales archaeon]
MLSFINQLQYNYMYGLYNYIYSVCTDFNHNEDYPYNAQEAYYGDSGQSQASCWHVLVEELPSYHFIEVAFVRSFDWIGNIGTTFTNICTSW